MILDIQRGAASPQINQLPLFYCTQENHQGDPEIVVLIFDTLPTAR